MDEKFAHVYEHALRVACTCDVNVDPTMPGMTGRQIHRCNAPASTSKYYHRNIAVPLINSIKAQLHEQFSGNEFSGYIDLC